MTFTNFVTAFTDDSKIDENRCKQKKYVIQYNNSRGNNNNKVNELYSLFLKFSALGLLQDIRNNFHS